MGQCQVALYIHYKRLRRRREKEKGTESLFRAIMPENFPNLSNETDSYIWGVQNAPNTRKPRRNIIIKLSKVKGELQLNCKELETRREILKAAREKQLLI